MCDWLSRQTARYATCGTRGEVRHCPLEQIPSYILHLCITSNAVVFFRSLDISHGSFGMATLPARIHLVLSGVTLMGRVRKLTSEFVALAAVAFVCTVVWDVTP
jgi:hypothetical protein